MSEIEPLVSPAVAPEPMTLDREDAPLLGNATATTHIGACDDSGGPELYEQCCAYAAQCSAAPTCCVATGGYSPIVPDLDRSGVHISCNFPSVTEMHDWAREQATSFAGDLLNHEDRRRAERGLLTEDMLRLPWLTTVAKIASRQIHVCCVPVSELAARYLKHELEKIRDSEHQATTWGGKRRWWITDGATQVTGADRVQRLVTAIIRAETTSHAFDSTSRCKVPKHQKQHDHSLFRTLAQNFVPPRAKDCDIESTKSEHATAGASRKIGVTATRDTIHSAGRKMFDLSISGAARDKLAAGRREVHCIKDLQHPNPGQWHQPGAVYTFVDQDMYIDDFSEFAGEDMCVITPEYNKLAGVGTDSVWFYTLNARDEVVVTERVLGKSGATYTNQRPWDYAANDFIYLEHRGKAAFTTYNVIIQYQAGTHHKWVWLPRNSTTRLSKAVCDMMCVAAQGAPLDGVPLRKADNVISVRGNSKVKQETYLLGLFGDANAPVFSIKNAYDQGPNTSMELTENQFKVFSLMGKNRPKGYGVSEVKRTLLMHTIWRAGGIEPLLVEFFGIPIEFRPRPNIMYTRQDGSTDDDVSEDANAVVGAPNPFGGNPGVADTRSDAAHAAYTVKRLKMYSNKIDPPTCLKEVLDKLLEQFIRIVSKETGIDRNSVPLCERQVIYNRRTAAIQAARLKRHAELDARPPLPKTLLKNEVAAKASAAPRGITQYDEEMAIQTGRVGLLLKEVLKNCSFYMPGESPRDIAQSIQYLSEMAVQAASEDHAVSLVSGMHDTDYTKMDETISEYIYGLFRKFTLAFVHPKDHDEVKKTLDDNVGIVTMINGKLVNTGYKNNSGSGVTTELNTVVAAFIEYVATCFAVTKYAHRARHKTEYDLKNITKNAVSTSLAYYAKVVEPEKIVHLLWDEFMFQDKLPDHWCLPYAAIGLKFGDDGVGAHLPHITDDDWGASAGFLTESIGMKLKVSFSRPQEGTFFLGRYYPQPLMTLASYADVLKACRKISVARCVDIEKYKLKLHGYWTTDSHTPGIREYLMAVARIYDVDLHKYEGVVETDEEGRLMLSREMAHLLANDKDMFYRVAGGPYCVEDEDVPTMLEAIAPQLNFASSTELETWLEKLSQCKTWDELDELQIPGMDYDPDDEPECTVRMSGPAANLLAAGAAQTSDYAANGCSLEDLASAALETLLEAGEVQENVDLEEDKEASDSACNRA